MKLEIGIQTGIPNEVYHADRKAISSTWLKKVERSPFHLRSYLDSPPAEPTPALVMGGAVDCLVFEPEMWKQEMVVAPEINRRTNAGREEWAKLNADAAKTGKRVIKMDQYQEALQTAKAIRNNPVMSDILKSGSAQQVFIWKDPVLGLLCKCKTDWYDPKTKTIYDLKAMRDAGPMDFSRAIATYGYHIQAAFYTDGVMACNQPVERFVFCVQEKPDGKDIKQADPRLMAFYELDAKDIEAGRDTYTSGLAAINFCMLSNEWEGYTNEIIPISRPAWARRTDVEAVAGL